MMRNGVVVRAVVAILALGFVAWAFVTGSYLLTALGFAAAYAVFTSGLNLFMGVAGQVSFGQSAFAAVGGYGSAVLTTAYGWPPLAALAVSAVLAALLAAGIGAVTLRLRGHYLAMATLALGLITYELSIEWEGLTQGYAGITGIPPMGIGRFEAASDREAFLVLVAAVALTLFANARLVNSRFGRALLATAGSEDAARALGIVPMRAKLAAFVIAAVEASIAGSLLAHFVGFISPEMFGLHMVVQGFTMLYVGGLGTLLGPVIGAVAVTLLPEIFRGFRDYQDLAYGAALLLILIFRPTGLAGLFGAIGQPTTERIAASSLLDAVIPLGSGNLLEVENVTRRFGGLVALDGVSFVVPEGGIHAIIGPNGAGKTTLFNVISGFTAPSSGTVRFAGRDIAGATPSTLAARGLVRTFQLVRLFADRDAAGNVEVGFHLRSRGGVLARCCACRGCGRRSGRSQPGRWRCCSGPGWAAEAPSRRRNCPMASSGFWKSHGRWRRARACCCWTSRPPG